MCSNVALVTGASRGVGRGIAVGLGESGWTVWVTARSSRRGGSTPGLPGTIEETAELVNLAGGRGIGVTCDHGDDLQVARLAQRITTESRGLSLLVNNVWGGNERLSAGGWEEWNAPFWEQPVDVWDAMHRRGVRAHYVATTMLAPLLIATPEALVVTVSGDLTEQDRPTNNVAYLVAQAADDRLVGSMHVHLRRYGVTSTGLRPGLVRTEGMMRFGEDFDLADAQSPVGVGRVVAALAADPGRGRFGGQALSVADLARRYQIDIS